MLDAAVKIALNPLSAYLVSRTNLKKSTKSCPSSARSTQVPC